MNVTIILVILFIHWVADFVFQTDKMAQGKSKNWGDLLRHTATYSFVFYVILPFYALYMGDKYVMWTGTQFVVITFIAHTLQDYFTSRLNSRLWEKKEVHYFFVSIGFDQFLHFAQLILTYHFLFNYS